MLAPRCTAEFQGDYSLSNLDSKEIRYSISDLLIRNGEDNAAEAIVLPMDPGLIEPALVKVH